MKEKVNKAASILNKRGISFTKHNNDALFIIDSKADYYTKSENWMIRKTKKKGYGLIELLKYI